jgi:hypothetical protein
MIRTPARIARRRRAAVAVEAAFVLPVLLLFFAATYELGRLGKIADALSNAARNGAQYGSANTTAAADTTSIRAAAVTELTNLPKVTSTNPTVTSSVVTHTGSTQQFIHVTVTYDMTGTSIFGYFNVTSMSRTIEMPMMPQ